MTYQELKELLPVSKVIKGPWWDEPVELLKVSKLDKLHVRIVGMLVYSGKLVDTVIEERDLDSIEILSEKFISVDDWDEIFDLPFLLLESVTQ